MMMVMVLVMMMMMMMMVVMMMLLVLMMMMMMMAMTMTMMMMMLSNQFIITYLRPTPLSLSTRRGFTVQAACPFRSRHSGIRLCLPCLTLPADQGRRREQQKGHEAGRPREELLPIRCHRSIVDVGHLLHTPPYHRVG